MKINRRNDFYKNLVSQKLRNIKNRRILNLEFPTENISKKYFQNICNSIIKLDVPHMHPISFVILPEKENSVNAAICSHFKQYSLKTIIEKLNE